MNKNEKQQSIRSVVTSIVDRNNNFVQESSTNKFERIVPHLLKKGVANLDLTMFSPELRSNLLIALGEAYRKKGNLHDAAKSFALAENKDKLNSVGEDYERIQQIGNSIEIYKLSGNKNKLIELGKSSLNAWL